MVALRKGCIAFALQCISVFLMVTLISANVIATAVTAAFTTAPGVEISRTSVSSLTNCDGVGTFFCPTGTCYTGYDGFVGCCSVSSCAARTTCIPYTSGVSQTCDMNTGGCVICTAGLPACVTITNVVNSQYVMYCGSMAFPPSQTQSSSAPMTSNMVLSTPIATSSTTTVGIDTSAATDGTTPLDMGTPPATVAAIMVGCVFGLVALIVISYYILQARRKREREMIQYVPHDRPGPGSSGPSTNAAIAMTPRRLKKPPGLRGRSMVSTTDANNPDDYLSPISGDRLARQAEARDARRAEELDGTQEALYMDLEGQMKDSWTPPAIRSNGEANPSARWSASNAPGPYKAYQPTNNLDSRISELSSIRHVQPSSSHEPSPPPSESTNPVSPNPSNYVDTPLVGGVSPLMDKWHMDDRASVGETSATVNGPINLFSPMHVQSRSSSSARVVSRSLTLTSATGAGTAYVSPETAMAEGYSAGHDESV